MQAKTKKIICEICALVLLTVFVYRPSMVLCWDVLDHYNISYNNIIVIAILVFLIPLPLCLVVKNVYFKIAMIYISFFLSMCFVGIEIFIRMWPA